MRIRLSGWLLRVTVAAVLAVAMTGLAGCQRSGFTKEEEQQLKQGPPAEMPAEARQAMERMRQGGNVPPPPPRPKGQPGPGAPFGPQ